MFHIKFKSRDYIYVNETNKWILLVLFNWLLDVLWNIWYFVVFNFITDIIVIYHYYCNSLHWVLVRSRSGISKLNIKTRSILSSTSSENNCVTETTSPKLPTVSPILLCSQVDTRQCYVLLPLYRLGESGLVHVCTNRLPMPAWFFFNFCRTGRPAIGIIILSAILLSFYKCLWSLSSF